MLLQQWEISPHEREIHIHTDFQCAVQRTEVIINNTYQNTPISHILKIPGWQTWESIRNVIEIKALTVKIFKVEAHSGNPLNEEADTLAKEARRIENPVYIHNNEIGSWISFALANRNHVIEKSTRKFLKHISQNVYKGLWTNHHTSEPTRKATTFADIDWKVYKMIIYTDGKIKEGFSSRKTANMQTYLVKLITSTLLILDLLYKK